MLQNTSGGAARSTWHSPHLMIPRGLSYDEAMRQFRWPKPKKLNIGRAVCERHNPGTLALIVENAEKHCGVAADFGVVAEKAIDVIEDACGIGAKRHSRERAL